MTIGLSHEVCVSFVHGFHDEIAVDHQSEHPALWSIRGNAEQTHRVRFPITPSDFDELPYPILGELPRTTRELQRRLGSDSPGSFP